ncbi:MAG: hypothetical protein WDZ37_04530 [Solirubrobacterales bacterium]
MEEQEQFQTAARAALAQHGIDVDDVDLAVIATVDRVYGPELDALMAADLSAIVPERAADFGRAPEPAGETSNQSAAG